MLVGNRFKKITIDKTNHINNRHILGFGDDSFDFSEALTSISVEVLEFVNFFPSKNDSRFKFVQRKCKELKYGNADLDNEYEMKYVNVEDNFVKLKIKTIYEQTSGKRIYKLPKIYKLKNLINKELQFYVISYDKHFKVCFIDIYHLAIPTSTQDTKSIFYKHADDKINLNEFML